MCFVSQKNQLFGMGQDEGVYQCVAINFMNGYDDRQQDFTEYQYLITQDARENFETAVHNKLVGYDIPEDTYPDTVYDRDVSPVSGIYHGIPTYAAILAMWGELFGMEHMADVQSVFYSMAIFLICFICQHLHLKTSSQIIASILVMVSPIVIWVAKSSLTEMLLAVLMLLFLYFLTDSHHPKQVIYSIIPIAAFACYHVSIYTMLPYVLLVYAILYFFTRRPVYAVLLPVTILGYLGSYYLMRQIQPFYTMNNYRFIFTETINLNTISETVRNVCIAALAVCLLYVLFIRFLFRSSSLKNILSVRYMKILLQCLLVCMTALPFIYLAYRAFAELESLDEINSLTIVGFAQNAGIVVLPLAVLACVLRPKTFLANKEKLVIFISFFYCVLLYASYMRFQIEYYDYYARYLVPFIPIAIVFSVTALDKAGGKLLYPAAALSLYFSMPYSLFLSNHIDDTRMEWETLQDIALHITSDDCIVIEDPYLSTLWLPLRAITHADVYPVESGAVKDQLDTLSKRYDSVYFISRETYTYDIDYNLQIVYMDVINCMEDKNTDAQNGMPLSFKAVSKEIYLYEYLYPCYTYQASTIHHFKLYGIDTLEETFCWTNSENAAFRCILKKDNYKVTVKLASQVPLGLFENESFAVSININGETVDTQEITSQNNGGYLFFEIPESCVQDGSNSIGFHTELWEASAINPDDTRMVGIALESVHFEAYIPAPASDTDSEDELSEISERKSP